MTWQIIHGDCLDVMRGFAPGQFDSVVTDPPYGIGRDGQKESTGKHGGRKEYEFKGWDSERPPIEFFMSARKVSVNQVIWGGNYFADLLPATSGWLVWDKGQRINQSDGELAWTSFDAALRIFVLNRVALMTDGAVHPTQKPEALMRWCLEKCSQPGDTVLDPFCGSGTTGVACIQTGRNFVGIELNEDYCRIARERCERAERQPDMFVRPAKPAQGRLL